MTLKYGIGGHSSPRHYRPMIDFALERTLDTARHEANLILGVMGASTRPDHEPRERDVSRSQHEKDIISYARNIVEAVEAYESLGDVSVSFLPYTSNRSQKAAPQDLSVYGTAGTDTN